MYTLLNLITGTTYGRFESEEKADAFRLTLDDFFNWDIDIL